MCWPVRPPNGCSVSRRASRRGRGSPSARKMNMVRSRRASPSRLLISLMLLAALHAQASAETPELKGLPLQLELAIDGKTTDRIAGFVLLDDGRLAARRTELLDLGLPIAPEELDEEMILDDIPQIRYTYDEVRQLVDVIIIRDKSDPAIHNIRPTQEKLVPDFATGLFVNYSLFG